MARKRAAIITDVSVHCGIPPEPGIAARSDGLVDCLTFFDGLQHLDISNRHGIHFERVLVENHQVGEFASFERALGRFFAIDVRAIDGNGVERPERCYSLLGADDFTAP